MSNSRRAAVLVGCVVIALLVAWYAGSRFPPPVAGPPAGTIRLGPEAGETVADYLGRLPAELPPAGVAAPVLVQFGVEQDPAAALATVAGTVPSIAVFRVRIPRVQTALRFAALEPAVPIAAALAYAQDRAGAAAATDAQRPTGRPRDIAAAEAAALTAPDCACVLAFVVRADRAMIDALALRPGVRAVQAAPPGVTDRELALSPLLPEQAVRADPLPDDGPVPGA